MANTLKFGDGKWGAKKDSILAYNDENANFKPLPFTTSRASTATRINKAGLIEKVENGIPRVDYLGNTKGAMLLEGQSTNKIQYSESFGNSYWNKSGAIIQGDPSTAGSELITVSANRDFSSNTGFWTLSSAWNISGGKLNVNGNLDTGTGTSCWRSGFLTIGTTYAITFTISNYVSGSFALLPSNDGGTYFTGNGTYTQTFMATGTNFGFNRGLALGGVTNLSIDNVSLKKVQGFASPSAETPLGAFKLVEDTTTGEHVIYKASVTVTSGATVSYSFFAKKGERNVIQTFNFVGGGYSNGADFDLSTGIVSNEISGSGKMLALSNGWYRCEFTSIALVGQSATNVAFRTLNASNQNNYTGDGTSGVYIFGAQLEQKSYATSYIPNYGESAGVTRLAETCSQTVPDGVIGQTEGTMFIDFNFDPTSDFKHILNIKNSTNSERVILYVRNSNLLRYQYPNGTYDEGSTLSSGNHKIAITYSGSNISFFRDGLKIRTNTDFAKTVTFSEISIGNYLNIDQLGNVVNQSLFYNTALTDSELQVLTTI